jgi:hypothetical protein
LSHFNPGQNNGLLIPNKSFKNVAEFGYFGIAVKNKNFIQKEI